VPKPSAPPLDIGLAPKRSLISHEFHPRRYFFIFALEQRVWQGPSPLFACVPALLSWKCTCLAPDTTIFLKPRRFGGHESGLLFAVPLCPPRLTTAHGVNAGEGIVLPFCVPFSPSPLAMRVSAFLVPFPVHRWRAGS